jgi:hypothetical protein
MMTRKIQVFGVSAVAVVAVAAGLTAYMAPTVAISTPGAAATITDGHDDPAPQRLQVAQVQTGGALTVTFRPKLRQNRSNRANRLTAAAKATPVRGP